MKLVRWLLLGVFATALFGVAFAPARAVVPSMAALDDVRGPWWNGEASVHADGTALGRLAWTLDVRALFAAEAALHWRFDNDGRRLAGRLAQGFSGFGLEAAGEVSSATIDHFVAAYDIDLGGVFTVENLHLRAGSGVLRASGALRWSGGRTLYGAGRQRGAIDLPAMRATLHLENDEALLAVTTPAAQRLAEARLQADGWLRARLAKRFLTLLGVPWPGTSADDDFVLDVAERCFEPPPEPGGRGLAVLLEGEFIC